MPVSCVGASVWLPSLLGRGRERVASTGSEAVDFAADLLGPSCRIDHAAIGAQHGELFAAVARDQVARAAHLRQQRGDCDDRLVASLVTERIVDALEVVDIDHNQAASLTSLLVGAALPRGIEWRLWCLADGGCRRYFVTKGNNLSITRGGCL